MSRARRIGVLLAATLLTLLVVPAWVAVWARWSMPALDLEHGGDDLAWQVAQALARVDGATFVPPH